MPAQAVAGPLDVVLRRHGARMVVRDGRYVAADFGSPTSEAAVCLSTVGVADRSDRATFELRGAAPEIDAALAGLAPLGERAWWARTGPQAAVARCARIHAPDCSAALLSGDVSAEISDRFAAIEVIGPGAAELVDAVGGDCHPVILRPSASAYELLVDAADGPDLWGRLLDAGAPLRVACVGLEALDHLAVSHRLSRPASPAIP